MKTWKVFASSRASGCMPFGSPSSIATPPPSPQVEDLVKTKMQQQKIHRSDSSATSDTVIIRDKTHGNDQLLALNDSRTFSHQVHALSQFLAMPPSGGGHRDVSVQTANFVRV